MECPGTSDNECKGGIKMMQEDLQRGIVKRAAEEHAYQIEEYIKLRIQSKPWWLPEFIWHFLLRRLLILQYFKRR